MKRIIFGICFITAVSSVLYAQDDFDDIYYNPSSKSTASSDSRSQKQKTSSSNYIANFSEMDVDAYNNRGFYYESDVDTIGSAVEAAEDFVYTQQIQKYYNPTIVLDNADVLADVLENSYGNVDIVIKNNVPVFSSIYYGDYGWAPGYYNWAYRPGWSWSYAWGPFSVSWNYGPYWGWDYWPLWSLGPSWGWGPGYHFWYPPIPHYHGHRPYYASYHRPGAYRPVNPGMGWSSRRPSDSRNHASASRPTRQPANRHQSMRSGSTSIRNDKFQANDRKIASDRRGNVTKDRSTATKSNSSIVNSSRRDKTESGFQTSTRRTNSETINRSNSSEFKHSTTTNSVNTRTTTTTRSSNRSYNSGSSGRSYNGASRSSGGGSSRSTGGSHGGGRGGRR